MKPHGLDPARLDVTALARSGATLDGTLPLAGLDRLAQVTVSPADGAAGDVVWSAQGLWAQPAGGDPEIRLHLLAQATVWLECQRCLQPAAQPLTVDRMFRFVAGEDEAARLDEDSEEDVLALPRFLKLPELIEDELTLELPIVPRHEACPQPLVAVGEVAADLPAELEERPNPFAALSALKRKASPG
jgi:uncharacterized protein